MSIPSFRQRSAIAYIGGQAVQASPEFLRWLDLLSQQLDDNTTSLGGDVEFAPVAVATTGRGDLGPVAPVHGVTDDFCPVLAAGHQHEGFDPV